MRALPRRVGAIVLALLVAGAGPAAAQDMRAPDPVEEEALPEAEVEAEAAAPEDTLPEPWPFLTVSVGVGMAGAGLWLALSGDSDRKAVSYDLGVVDEDGHVTGVSEADARDRLDRADAYTIAGGVLLGVGIAAAIGGTVWAIMGGTEAAPEDEELAPVEDVTVHVGPAGVGLSGRF